MNDERKSKAKLILELKTLRRQVQRCRAITGRAARTAEALRESEAKYRLLVENSIDAVLLTSPDGGIQDANKAACRMFGRTVRELRQLGRRAVVDLSDPRLAQAIEGHKRMGKFKGELTFLRKDGSKFPGEISSAVFKDKDGNPRTSMSIRDISERKRVEETLALLAHTIRSIGECVSVTDAENKILFVNDAFLRTYDYTADELIGKPITVVRSPRSEPAAENVLSTTLEGGWQGELVNLKKDGTEFLIALSTSVVRNEKGQPIALVGIAADITERKRAEENLRQSEDRYRDLVEHSQDLICTHDLEGRLLTVNSTAVKMLGYSLDEIAKMSMCDFLAPDVRRLFDRYLRRVSRDHFAKGQLIVQTKSGERRIWEYDNTLRTEGVTKPFVRGWARDITERKLAEQANKRAEQLQHAVYRIAQAAAESAGLDDLFRSVHKIIGTVVEAKNFYIALYDEAKEFVHFPYFVDEKDAPPPPRKTRKGLTEYVLRTGKPLICDEATKAELHRNGDVESIGTHPAVWLGVPLIVGKKTSGVMAVQHYSDPNAYGKQDLQMLEYVSSQVAKAIEQKQAEEALRESEERFRQLYQQAPLGYQSLDAEGWFIDVNQAWLDLLGYSRDQVIGHWFGDFLAPQEVDAFKQRFPCFKATGEVHVDLEMVQRAGSKIIVHIDGKIGHDEHGQFKQTHCILHDITERKRAEEALRQSEDNFKALAENASDGILIATEAEGRHVFANRRAVEITGYPIEDLLKTRIRDLAHPDDLPKIAERYKKRLEGLEVPKPYETAILNKDGIKVAIEISPSRTIWQDQPADMVILRDITERKQREEEQAYETRLHKFRSEMAYSVNRQLSLREILQQSAEVIMRNLDIACAQIWTMNRGTNSLELQAHGELSTPCTESDECIHMGNLLASWVVAGRQTIASNSILDKPLLIDASWARHHNIVAYAGLPLFVEDRLVGVLTIYAGTLLLDRTLSALAVSAVTLGQGIMRKWVEDALRESEERHRSLVEAAPDVIYTISAEDGSLTSLNPAFETVTGWSRAEWIGRPFASLVHPDDLPLAEQTFQRALRGESQPPYELRVLSKSGNCLVGEFTSTPQIKDGKVVGELGIARDITERKKMEQALQQERILLRTLIDNLPDAIYVKDTASRKTIANLADVHNTGRQSEAEVLGKDDFELFPKDLAERFFADDQSVIQTGQPILEREEYVLDAEGQKRWLLTSKLPLRDEEGQVVGLVGIGRDITSRKRAEEALRESEERFRRLSAGSFEGIIIHDGGKIVDANEAFVAMFGYGLSESIGKNALDFATPALRGIAERHIRTESEEPYEGVALHKDGSTFDVEVRGKNIPYEGRMLRVTALLDITDRKLAELASKRAEEALRYERNLLRTLIDNLPDAVYVKDTECRKTVANVADVRYMGQQSEADVLGKTDFDFYPADAAAAYHADDQSVVQTGQPMLNKGEFLVDKEGKEHWFSTSKLPLRDEQGRIIGLVGVGRDITERKRAEEALRESEEKYRNVVERANDGIAIVQDRVVKYVNATLAEAVGCTIEELIGTPFADYIYPDDLGKVADRYKRRTAGEDVAPVYEIAVRHKDGSKVYVEVNAGMIMYQGKPAELVIVRDLTERKRAEVALRLEKENFRRSLDESPLGVRIVTADGDTLYANRAILDFYGYDSLEELRKTPLRARYTPESYAEFQKRKQQRERGDFSASEYGISIIRKNGEVLHLQVHRKQVLWDNAKQFLVIYQDITERRRAEEALRESEAKYRELVEAISDVIYEIDSRGVLTYVSPVVRDVLGYQAEDLIGKSLIEFGHPEDRGLMSQRFSDLMGGVEYPMDYRLIAKSGEVRWVRTRTKPITKANVFSGARGTLMDITQHKLAEEKTRQSELQFHTVWESSLDGMRLTDEDGNALAVNDSYCRLARKAREEIEGKPLSVVYGEERQAHIQKRHRERFMSRTVKPHFEEELTLWDGRKAWFEVSNSFFELEGQRPLLLSMFRDITERKRAEAALRTSEAQLSNALKIAHLGHWEYDVASDLFTFTDHFYAMLRTTAGQVGGYTMSSAQYAQRFVHPDDMPVVGVEIRKALETTDPHYSSQLEHRIIYADGATGYITVRIFIVRDDQGRTIKTYGVNQDITERKLAEQASKRAEEQLKSSREQLRALAAHLHRVREEERKRLAREFHDQLGQTLTALKMDLTMLQRQVADKEKELSRTAVNVEIQAMQQIADHAVASIREIMAELRPELLDQLGILPALEFEAESFQGKSGIPCIFTSLIDEIQLDQEKSIALFRIFQEALTNVARHAKATSVRANIRMEGKNLLLEIKDNGVGISPGVEDAKDSFGIIGMRERALVFGGMFEIRGAKGEGTTIVLRLPLEETLADGGGA